MISKYHQEIISSIQKYSGNTTPNFDGFGLKYVGSIKPSFHLDTKSTRQVARDFVIDHHLPNDELVQLLTTLYSGKTYDEVTIAAKIIEFSPKLRQLLSPQNLHSWIAKTHGWAEADTLCQMAFNSEDLLSRWSVWEKAIKKYAQDKNVQVRRSSLVLLTKPFRQSDDPRLVEVAIHNLDLLKFEKDILITKAVSWILRAMIKNHKETVARYLEENLDYLPKIAIREVRTKLDTGKKYVNKKKSSLQK